MGERKEKLFHSNGNFTNEFQRLHFIFNYQDQFKRKHFISLPAGKNGVLIVDIDEENL